MSGLHVESAGAGAPLVLLHGFAMHGGLWSPLVAPLAKRFRVHVVDLPGHGHSAAVEPFTLDAMTAAVRQAFDAEREPLVVVGWSLGAFVAMAWALAAPQRIARLVLVAATARFVAADDWPHAMERETLRRFHDELRVAYRLTLNRFLALQLRGSERGRAALASMRAQLFARGEPSRAALDASLDVLASADLRDRARDIAVPTLVVAGSRDALTRPQAGAWLAQSIPGARLSTIDGAAHVPFVSHPREFMAALDAFLDGDAA